MHSLCCVFPRFLFQTMRFRCSFFCRVCFNHHFRIVFSWMDFCCCWIAIASVSSMSLAPLLYYSFMLSLWCECELKIFDASHRTVKQTEKQRDRARSSNNTGWKAFRSMETGCTMIKSSLHVLFYALSHCALFRHTFFPLVLCIVSAAKCTNGKWQEQMNTYEEYGFARISAVAVNNDDERRHCHDQIINSTIFNAFRSNSIWNAASA